MARLSIKKKSAARVRPSGEPAEATARKIAILIELIRVRRLSLAKVQRAYGISDRQALRDLQELRRIGASLGFTITRRNAQGNVELADFKTLPGSVIAAERCARSLIAEIFKAFGEPLHGLTEGIDDASNASESSFVRVIMPRLVEGSAASALLQQLQSAWQSGARVRFRYGGKEREVEPAAVLVRSGRYYLLGRQVSPAAWRLFSLDEIAGVKRCGTFAPKPPPAEYLSGDTIGFIKSGRKQRVAVTVSKRFAHTAASRCWQQAQTLAHNADGTVTMTFSVGDPDEVIRWALGYGAEAWISAPPAAVARAKALARDIAARYDA